MSSIQANNLSFYGHGKILLSGEYFVLDGAKSLGLPTTVGQNLLIKHRKSYRPTLKWRSYDNNKNLWFECEFEFWHFDLIGKKENEQTRFLQKILRQARKQNSHFLREEMDIVAESHLEFPLEWGLGSSSTLIYNIAQWAYVGPFELLFKTIGGSGYDIACAQANGPILYEKKNLGPTWGETNFAPPFIDQLFLIYLGKKRKSSEAIASFVQSKKDKSSIKEQISNLTLEFNESKKIEEFNKLIKAHELIISDFLETPRVKKQYFDDFWGEVKSLGAWGGDFALVTSDRTHQETKNYFLSKGLDVFIPFKEMVLMPQKEA